jgi:hypothetical protein
MKRSIASVAAALIIGSALGIAQPAQAAGGGEALAVSNLGRVSFTVADGEFDGPEARIPLKFAYERWGNDYGKVLISVNLTARQLGSRINAGFLDSSVQWGGSAAQQGTGDGAITVRATSSSKEPFLIYGSARFLRYDEDFNVSEEIQVAFQPVPLVTVAQDVTTLSNVRVGPKLISGKATVESVFGTIGAGGAIAVRYRGPRDRNWTYVTDFVDCPFATCTGPNPMGNFRLEPSSPIPSQARVEVSIYDCGWCTDASQTVTRGA